MQNYSLETFIGQLQPVLDIREALGLTVEEATDRGLEGVVPGYIWSQRVDGLPDGMCLWLTDYGDNSGREHRYEGPRETEVAGNDLNAAKESLYIFAMWVGLFPYCPAAMALAAIFENVEAWDAAREEHELEDESDEDPREFNGVDPGDLLESFKMTALEALSLRADAVRAAAAGSFVDVSAAPWLYSLLSRYHVARTHPLVNFNWTAEVEHALAYARSNGEAKGEVRLLTAEQVASVKEALNMAYLLLEPGEGPDDTSVGPRDEILVSERLLAAIATLGK